MSRLRLYLWVSAYAFFWSLTTLLLDPAVPYDAVEALNWAQNSEWGSPKNPWLVGMMWRPALLLPAAFYSAYWYITHFLAVSVGMLGTWYLTRDLSGSQRLAWLALLTLNLSGLINFDIISYNDNYLLVMLWPWMMVFLFRAVTRHSAWWIPFGIVAGLACMAKYSTLSFIGSVFITTLILPSVRKCYRQPNFYLALLAGLAILSPNIYWLWEHDFAAFQWVDSQVRRGFNPALILKILSVFYPLLFLQWILCRYSPGQCWPEAPGRQAVALSGCLPLIPIGLFFLFHHGGRLTEWIQPFFIIAPALLAGCFTREFLQPPDSVNRSLAGAAVVILLGYVFVMTANLGNAGKKMSGIADFSQNAEALWRERYGAPLRFVGGEHLAEWLLFYAPSSPRIITPWNSNLRPNIYNADIRYSDITESGALLIGRSGEKCSFSSFERSLKQWPQLTLDTIREITYREDVTHAGNNVCLGFVKPSDSSTAAERQSEISIMPRSPKLFPY